MWIVTLFQVLVVLSNLSFFSLVVITFLECMFFDSLLWIVMLGVSFLYHLCGLSSSACFLYTYDTIRMVDHLMSSAMIFVLVLYISYYVHCPKNRVRRYIEVIVTFLVSAAINWPFVFIYGHIALIHQIVLVIAVPFVLCAVIAYRYYCLKKIVLIAVHKADTPYNMKYVFKSRKKNVLLIVSLLFIFLGWALFILPHFLGYSCYLYTHTFWHLFLAFGISLLAITRFGCYN